MTLQERLTEDFKAAMKAHDEVKKNTLSFARAAIKQVEVDTRKEVEDGDVLAILKAGRTDLLESYKAEIEILEAYLPEQMSEDDIRKLVKETAAEVGVEGGKQNMGKLMKSVMPKVKGLADGNTVRKIIEEFLA